MINWIIFKLEVTIYNYLPVLWVPELGQRLKFDTHQWHETLFQYNIVLIHLAD